LGEIYASGSPGVPKDDEQALFWFTKAAQDGNAYGMNNLGAMSEKGRGGLKRDEAHVEGLVS